MGKRAHFHVQTSSFEEKQVFTDFRVLYSMDFWWYTILELFLPKFFIDAHYILIYSAIYREWQTCTFSSLNKSKSGKIHILPIFIHVFFMIRLPKKICPNFLLTPDTTLIISSVGLEGKTNGCIFTFKQVAMQEN